MRKTILISFLSLFGLALLSSYWITIKKIEKNNPKVVYTTRKDLDEEAAAKAVANYNNAKHYFWNYKIQKTYHRNGMGITTSADTLSKELMIEDK